MHPQLHDFLLSGACSLTKPDYHMETLVVVKLDFGSWSRVCSPLPGWQHQKLNCFY